MPVWIESILLIFAKAVVQWAAARAEAEGKKAWEKIEKDKEREETNEENVARYNNANSEAESLQAALDLLNRTRR